MGGGTGADERVARIRAGAGLHRADERPPLARDAGRHGRLLTVPGATMRSRAPARCRGQRAKARWRCRSNERRRRLGGWSSAASIAAAGAAAAGRRGARALGDCQAPWHRPDLGPSPARRQQGRRACSSRRGGLSEAACAYDNVSGRGSAAKRACFGGAGMTGNEGCRGRPCPEPRPPSGGRPHRCRSARVAARVVKLVR